jgi:hypothetical protein
VVEQYECEVVGSIRGGDNYYFEVVWVVSRECDRKFRYPKITHISIALLLSDVKGTPSNWTLNWQK